MNEEKNNEQKKSAVSQKALIGVVTVLALIVIAIIVVLVTRPKSDTVGEKPSVESSVLDEKESSKTASGSKEDSKSESSAKTESSKTEKEESSKVDAKEESSKAKDESSKAKDESSKVATESSKTTSESSKTTQSGGNTNSKPSGTSNNGATQSCNHDWVAQYKTVHHDKVTHQEQVQIGSKTVVDEEAWDENAVVGTEYYIQFGDGTEWVYDPNNIPGDFEDRISDYMAEHQTGYGVFERPITQLIHHEAITHEEPIYETRTIVDQEARDEQVLNGYKCSKCGATK